MLLDGLPHSADPLAGSSDRRQDWRTPGTLGTQIKHLFQIADGLGDTVPIGLVDDKQVTDFEKSRPYWLERCRPSPG